MQRVVFPWTEAAGLDSGRAHTVCFGLSEDAPSPARGSHLPLTHSSKAVGCVCVHRPAVAAFLNPSRRSQASMVCRLPVSVGTRPRCVRRAVGHPAPRLCPAGCAVSSPWASERPCAAEPCDRPHRELLPCHRGAHGADRDTCPGSGSQWSLGWLLTQAHLAPQPLSLLCTSRFSVPGPVSGCGTGSFQKGGVGQGPAAGCGWTPPSQRCSGLGPPPPDRAQLPVPSSDSTVTGGPQAPSPQTCLLWGLRSGCVGAGSAAQMVFILA